MKKSYSKPEILFESFAMSTSIATTCEVRFELQAKDVCGYPGSAPGLTIFATTYGGCTVEGKADDEYNGLCYNVPDETYNLFQSG